MQMIADILLAAGALGAALYCMVLARRLKRFNNLQNGMGGAVAVLSAQVDDMTKTLQQAQKAAATSSNSLTALTERADGVAKRLELMLAAMHDLPEASQDSPEQVQPVAAGPARPATESRPPGPKASPVPPAAPGPRQPQMRASGPSPAAAVPSAPAPDRDRVTSPAPQHRQVPPAPGPEPFAQTAKEDVQDTPVFLSHRDHRIEAAG